MAFNLSRIPSVSTPFVTLSSQNKYVVTQVWYRFLLDIASFLLGAAGGDLTGTYPNPKVVAINGVTLGVTTATSGNLLIGSGTAWVSTSVSGDGTLSSLGALTVTKTNGVVFATSATTDTTNANNISSGTLVVVRGGTGQTTYTNGQLLIGNTTGNTLTKSTLTAGTATTITNGTGTISISVNLAAKTDENTGTSTNLACVPANTYNNPAGVKAWGSVANGGASATLADSFNIASVSRTGVGVVTVTLTPTLSNSNYSVFIQIANNTLGSAKVNITSSTQFTVSTFTLASVAADVNFNLLVVGHGST